MPKLSDAFIQEVLDKTDIIDIISEKVTLSKKGKSYFGLCPFHNEKTPSFSVEPDRKIYNCFSCGEKGNAVTFLQKTNNISFIEAIEDLAIRANVDMDFTEFKTEHKDKRLFEINEAANTFYKLYLNSTKSGLEAKQYLKERGIKEQIMKYFELGLASNEFDLLHKTLTNQDFLVSDLHDLGLVKKSQTERFYDLFRERIIFPIKDEHGNTVAFSGRTYKQEDDSAKYINSPQTKIFTKSNVLYNLHNAINDIKKNDRVMLFEGYMDVIAAYRANIKESVASMGTSLTKEQIRLLKKYTNNVYICYDGDAPGIEAAGRAVKMAKDERMSVRIVILPNNQDPDDYIKQHGSEALLHYIETAWIDPLEFDYKSKHINIDFTKMLDIEQFKKNIFDMIKDSSNTVIDTYLKRISEDTKLSLESIRQDFSQYTNRSIKRTNFIPKKSIKVTDKYTYAERRLMSYYLDDRKYLFNYNRIFDEVFYVNGEIGQLKYILEEIYLDNDIKILNQAEIKQSFLESLTEAQYDLFMSQCENRYLQLSVKEYDDCITAMEDYQKKLWYDHIDAQIANADTIKEKIRLQELKLKRLKEDQYGQR